MPVKNEQLNFAIIIILLFAAIFIAFLLLRPTSVASFIPYLLVIAPLIFLIALFNTDIALILLIFSMLLSPELSLGGVRGRAIVLRLDDIFLLLIFFGWMAKMAVNKEFGLLKSSSLLKPIFVYIFICIISSGIGVLRGTTKPLTSFLYIFKYVEYFLVFFMVRNNIRSKAQVKVFVMFMFITATIVGAYGLFSALALGMRATAPFEGNIGEANTLAGYLMLMMGIAGGILLYGNKSKTGFLLGGFLLLSIWPFLYTYSRSGLIGFFVMYLVFIIIVKRYKLSIILSFMILAVIAPIIFQKPIFWRARRAFSVGGRYEVLGGEMTIDDSGAARLRSLQESFDKWKQNPLLGEGVGTGRAMYDVQYARTLREVGVVGSLAFFWILATLLKVGWRTFRNTDLDNFSRGLSLGYFCAFIGMLVMGIGAEVFIIIRIMEPFWFLTAIVVALPEVNKISTAKNLDLLMDKCNINCIGK